jgi:thioredoxin reductase
VALAVVGGGPAGLAAATAAARAGVEVLLVDENPLDHDLMAMDVPLWFGQRMSPSLRHASGTLARLVETTPGLAEAHEAGVDVQLGAVVWGAFAPGPTARELEGLLLGLADGRRSWLVACDRLVVAAGARDLALSFPGWTHAGVMGANAVALLLGRYRATTARRLVVLGSGPLGLRTAALAVERGVEVAGVVEVGPEVRGAGDARSRLERAGVPFFTRHTVKAARDRAGEVRSVVLAPVDADLRPLARRETEVECDTVCLAIGLVPAVELLDLLGCRLVFRSERSGFVPDLDVDGQTSVPGVFAAGDCAGFDESMAADAELARAQGQAVGLAAARSLGAGGGEVAGALPGKGTPADPAHAYWGLWLESLLHAGGWDVAVCQCEEVTRRELVDVQPPRYLGAASPPMRARTLGTLLGDGPVSPDQVKRLTRVGMGPCQGRRCREEVALLLAREAKIPVAEVPLATHRPPVRPLPLSVLWPHDEPEAVREHWVSWFGIPTQFAPHWQPSAGSAPAAPPDPPGK